MCYLIRDFYRVGLHHRIAIMKAWLTFGEKKEVDVEYIGETPKVKFYKDKNNGKVYPEDALEFKEYYGG